ncbi:uncharacterized protein TRAVEDRAFT_70124, partial [Trametes versicolor FP-101664 SS1]|uniref:uncharacterized protein n=1 Tax=Trametes versicolor (strain FP-101664) TaxID=717944 RepID=UPI0004622449
MYRSKQGVPMVDATPEYMATHAERIQRWRDVLQSDPRRGVRTLTIRGMSSESIEGDTALDTPYVIARLGEIVKEKESRDVWVKLVDAGVVNALCKCALNFQAVVMHNPNHNPGHKPTSEEIERASKPPYSPYQAPLEIVCMGIAFAPQPISSTEKKIIADLRLHWNALMTRIWSEPARSLDKSPRAIIERVLVAQLVMTCTSFDASFLEMLLKPGDMTLAVIMRNWMHSTTKSDHTANTIILTAFLGGPLLKPWAGYIAEHPFPAPRLVFARILVGASRGAEGTKKRTPVQAADAIISAFTTHFETLEFAELEAEVKFFLKLCVVCAEEHRPFVRAFLKSSKFWAAVASVLRRSKQAPQESQQRMLAFLFLQLYVNGSDTMEKEGREYVDTTIYNWISGGLLGALDDIVDLLTWPRNAMILTNIVSVIMTHIEVATLSTKTLAALRAELPRPRIVKRMIVAGSTVTGDRESEARSRETMRGMKQMLGGGRPDENNGAWLQGVWQLLQSITFAVQDTGACTRRGCDRRAGKGAGTTCEMCKVTVNTSYCSKVCMQKDAEEHGQICGWVHVLESCRRESPAVIREPSGSVVAAPDIA